MSAYSNKASSRQIKVVFIGDSSVGKTCIALRAVNNSFSNVISPTVGGAHLSLTIKSNRTGEDVNFSIWDTAGQEEYRTLVPLYFQNADVCLVTFDLTNKESFNHIDDWLRIMHKSAPENVEMVLVGNKVDLADGGDNRVISFEMGLSFSHEIGAVQYIETSALTGQNVAELFEQLADDEFLMREKRGAEVAPLGVDIAQQQQQNGGENGESGGFSSYYQNCAC